MDSDIAGGTAHDSLSGEQNAAWVGKELHEFVANQLGDLGNLVDFLGLVLDNVYAGIIVCDRNCRIVFMNQVYADLLKTDRMEALGKHIEEFFPNSRLPQVMEEGKPELGQRCSLKTETMLLVNRIPLIRQGRVTGVILHTIFRDYKSFTELARKLNVLEHEVKFQRKALDVVLSSKYTFESIIGRSKIIEDAKILSRKYAQTDSPVLILGPTGTGKELFAHAVHSASPRCMGPFVSLNCAGIPRDLLESELFGYEAGAFTGAGKSGKTGQIELAHRGTLYLDEIGELPMNAQAKLLRVLEQKLLAKVGGVKPVPVDFRLVAATNRDLNEMIRRGDFREDFYYRLNAMTVNVPSLSQRPDDIPVLIRHFLSLSDKSHVQVSDEAVKMLKAYRWPGNVRELKNVVERALSLAEGPAIHPEHLPAQILGATCAVDNVSWFPNTRLNQDMARFEKSVLIRALSHAHKNMSKAAKMLGISRSTLYEKCRRHGIVTGQLK
jgi:transcriptional regulator with PAS, ATPase and Fis domain